MPQNIKNAFIIIYIHVINNVNEFDNSGQHDEIKESCSGFDSYL